MHLLRDVLDPSRARAAERTVESLYEIAWISKGSQLGDAQYLADRVACLEDPLKVVLL